MRRVRGKRKTEKRGWLGEEGGHTQAGKAGEPQRDEGKRMMTFEPRLSFLPAFLLLLNTENFPWRSSSLAL